MYTSLYEKDNRKIIDTKHSIDRYLDRYKGQFSKEQISEIIKEVIDKIIKNYHDKMGQYGFHSKSTGVGGIITWRKEGDPKLNNNLNHAIVSTLFPVKPYHNFKDVEAKIIIENQILLWAKEKRKEGLFEKIHIKKSLCECIQDSHDWFIDSFSVTFFEGHLYDYYLDGYILI